MALTDTKDSPAVPLEVRRNNNKLDEQLRMRIIGNGAGVMVWVQCRLRKLDTIIYYKSSTSDIIRRPRIAMCNVFPVCHRLGGKVEGTARF
jgi:hypothetical protein